MNKTTSAGRIRIVTMIATNGQWIASLTGTDHREIVVAEADEEEPAGREVIKAVKKAFGVKLKVRT